VSWIHLTCGEGHSRTAKNGVGLGSASEGQPFTPILIAVEKRTRKKAERKIRGVFEKVPGSGIWWVRHSDTHGRLRREKAGSRGMGVKLYQKRKMEALQGRKLPESIRHREILLSELLADAAEHTRLRYRGHRLGSDGKDYRYAALDAALADALGNRPAESVTAQEVERAIARLAEKRGWKPASFNRHKAFLSLVFRLGVEGGKVAVNPVRLVRRRREDNGRIHWLTADEETKLRAVIQGGRTSRV
jgi:hypothetical protein